MSIPQTTANGSPSAAARKYYVLVIRGGEVFPLTESRLSRNLLLFDNVKTAKRHAIDHWKPGVQDAIVARLDAKLS